MEGVSLRGKSKKTWIEVAEKDCRTRQLNNQDAIDSSKWRKLIKDMVQNPE